MLIPLPTSPNNLKDLTGQKRQKPLLKTSSSKSSMLLPDHIQISTFLSLWRLMPLISPSVAHSYNRTKIVTRSLFYYILESLTPLNAITPFTTANSLQSLKHFQFGDISSLLPVNLLRYSPTIKISSTLPKGD